MPRTITTKALALVLGTIATVGLVSVPASTTPTTGRHCLKLNTVPLEPGRDYEVFPDNLDATMQSLQAAIMRQNSKAGQPSARPIEPGRDYEVFPDNLDATMQSLQAAIMRRDSQPASAAPNQSATLIKC